jgi:hypothetical protein
MNIDITCETDEVASMSKHHTAKVQILRSLDPCSMMTNDRIRPKGMGPWPCSASESDVRLSITATRFVDRYPYWMWVISNFKTGINVLIGEKIQTPRFVHLFALLRRIWGLGHQLSSQRALVVPSAPPYAFRNCTSDYVTSRTDHACSNLQ